MTATCRELLKDLWADADEVVRRHLSDQEKLHQAYQLAARVEKVLALHADLEGDDSDGSYAVNSICAECKRTWPCPTVRILDGEEP